ncbi:hypothetical protein [Almyronema epifaneia]|uniref:Uncharacterized protein n=1 Tax=Almyronema epifaneia S1 TaxID=2991925 RepID=A0ABW6IC83_9CYAN
MAKPSCAPLKNNPFVSQRDPITGKWQVMFPLPKSVSAHPKQRTQSPG